MGTAPTKKGETRIAPMQRGIAQYRAVILVVCKVFGIANMVNKVSRVMPRNTAALKEWVR
jgi:hypothetical protein